METRRYLFRLGLYGIVREMEPVRVALRHTDKQKHGQSIYHDQYQTYRL